MTIHAKILVLAAVLALAGHSNATVLGTFTDVDDNLGLNGPGFPGAFLVTDSISSCDPEFCTNLVPVIAESFTANSTAPLTFVADAANNPNWSTIVALLGNDDSFLTFCTGTASQPCGTLRANTIGNLFFPGGGSFFGDSIGSISITFNPLSVSVTPSAAFIDYNQTISVLSTAPAPSVPEPASAALILAGVSALLAVAARLRIANRRAKR